MMHWVLLAIGISISTPQQQGDKRNVNPDERLLQWSMDAELLSVVFNQRIFRRRIQRTSIASGYAIQPS